jgi:alpha 1,3-glucosidase
MEAHGVRTDGVWQPEDHDGHVDYQSRGPASVGLDFGFDGATHMYGIPERAAPLALWTTQPAGGAPAREPYRLYNLDVFEYEPGDPMPLYGAVPFALAGELQPFWRRAVAFWLDL